MHSIFLSSIAFPQRSLDAQAQEKKAAVERPHQTTYPAFFPEGSGKPTAGFAGRLFAPRPGGPAWESTKDEGLDCRKAIRMAAFGMDQELINSRFVWICTGCELAWPGCPMGVKLVGRFGRRPRRRGPGTRCLESP